MTDIIENSLKESVFNLLLYTVFGILVFVIVWILLKDRWRWRRIQPKSEHRKHHFRHDLLYSFASIVMAGCLTTVILMLDQAGYYATVP